MHLIGSQGINSTLNAAPPGISRRTDSAAGKRSVQVVLRVEAITHFRVSSAAFQPQRQSHSALLGQKHDTLSGIPHLKCHRSERGPKKKSTRVERREVEGEMKSAKGAGGLQTFSLWTRSSLSGKVFEDDVVEVSGDESDGVR